MLYLRGRVDLLRFAFCLMCYCCLGAGLLCDCVLCCVPFPGLAFLFGIVLLFVGVLFAGRSGCSAFHVLCWLCSPRLRLLVYCSCAGLFLCFFCVGVWVVKPLSCMSYVFPSLGL